MNSTARPATLHPVVHETQRRYAQLPKFFRWFSEHCVLRQIDASDVSRIWQAVLHPAFDRCWTGTVPGSEGELATLVQQAQTDWQRGTRYTMAILRKQTHEFVGFVEVRAGGIRGAWMLDWFFHPDFVADALAREALTAAAELMFGALDAQTLFANCPRNHWLFEQMLNDTGFTQLVPAGSIDPASARPRVQSLFELGRRDWNALRGLSDTTPLSSFGSTAPKLELSLL